MATYAAYRHVELDNVGYGKKRVLKPPGGGSSDIFGAAPDESPRRVKHHNQSQLGSALFGDNNGTESPRISNKPGNDSYKRLFGPPDAPPTPNSKNHMRSNIPFSGDRKLSSPAKSTSSNSSSDSVISNGMLSNGNHKDFTAFRKYKRFRGMSCMPRNPVTGDGIDVMPLRRIARRIRDGNPITGTGYGSETSVTDSSSSSSPTPNGSEKSTESTPSSNGTPLIKRNRVPPGGYSSGLW